MPLPAGWQLIHVTGTYQDQSGNSATGYLIFESAYEVVVGGTIVVPKIQTALLDAYGQISIYLPATNDPDLSTVGWTYQVQEIIPNARAPFFINVLYNGGPIDMSTVVPVIPSSVAPASYVRTVNGITPDNTGNIIVITGGAASTETSFVSDHPGTLSQGMAVTLVNGLLRRATSLSPFNKPIGLVFEDALLQGISGRVVTGGLFTTTTPMWDLATGMVGGLAANSVYFLSSTGAITPFAPTAAGEYVVPIGTALSSTTLRIELNNSIFL